MSRSAAVPRAFPDATIVCAASGPSLTTEDLDACAGLPKVAVNDTYRLIPEAVAIFAADAVWWARTSAAGATAPHKYYLSGGGICPITGVHRLARTGQTGLELEPTGLRSGGHSGYAAINLAYHLGARKIILLGYDMRSGPDGQHHWFGEHPDRSHPRYAQWLPYYTELSAALAQEGVTLINASRVTVISTVRHCTLEEALHYAA